MDMEDVYTQVDKEARFLEEKDSPIKVSTTEHPFWVCGVIWKQQEQKETGVAIRGVS